MVLLGVFGGCFVILGVFGGSELIWGIFGGSSHPGDEREIEKCLFKMSRGLALALNIKH